MRNLLAGLAALLALNAAAQSAAPVAGRDYQLLEPPRAAERAHIEVIEFFWYGCPVCYETQPRLARWLQANPDVRLRRVPAVNDEGWEAFARAYFALEALDALERLHWPLYDNHHFDNRRLDEEANLLAWAAANGVDAARFKEALHSVETRQKVEFARRELGTFGVRGVPAFVVNGRFLTSARMTGGVPQMMEVVDFLVTRVRQEQARK